jgi:hypothetical protein
MASQLVQMSPKQQGIDAPQDGAPFLEAETRWVPDALDATANHCWPDAAVPVVSSVQVIPESGDVQMLAALPYEDAATRWVPEASDATATHSLPEASVPAVRLVQVVPESVETQMSPPYRTPPDVMDVWQTATRCVPVASDATPCQSWPEAAVPLVRLVHVAPESGDVQISLFAVMATKWVPVASDAMSTQYCAAKEVPAV